MYQLTMELEDRSKEMLKRILAGASLPINQNDFRAPVLLTNDRVDAEDMPENLMIDAVPTGLYLPYVANMAATIIIMGLKSPGLRNYQDTMIKKYGGVPSPVLEYQDPFMYFVVPAPQLTRRYRGWIANMSTTLATSTPALTFVNPRLEEITL